MIDKRIVIEYAKSQVGYHEKASNADLDDFTANSGSANFTKFARDLDAISEFYNGKKQGYAWCDCFVDACFQKCYSTTLALKLLCQPPRSAGAGCQYSAQYYEQQGRFFCGNPQPGDQIFFDYGSGISHTGIVVEVSNTHVTTVEGNSNDQVQQNTYPLNASYIAGYGRPNWDIEGTSDIPTLPDPVEPTPDVPTLKVCEVTVTLPIIRYGDVSPWVKLMQTILIERGFSCGWYGADGEFGTQTKIALFEFRKANNLQTEDILCDSEAWTELLKI